MNQPHPLDRENNLMVSISGVRGIIPSGLDLNNLPLFIRAFSQLLPGKALVIGRDSRPSGEYIERITTGILQSLGREVISLGITTTPTVKSVIKETKSAGGIMISASHNPVHWNAFKFIGKNGFFIGAEQIEQWRNLIIDENLVNCQFSPNGKIRSGQEFEQLHIDSVLQQINSRKIKRKKFKVLIDAVNGGGSYIIPRFLQQLACRTIEIHCQPDGKFPRPPEPTIKALKKTSQLMKQSGADIGFALDPDADRLVVLTPKRGVISEEYTLPLSLLSPLMQGVRSKNAVVNLSTSFISQAVLEPHGKGLLRSKVGEANVVAMIQEKKSFFGGEGNGGVIDPKISSFGRDSLAGIAHILNYLTESGQTIDQVMDTLPPIHMKKDSFPITGKNLPQLMEAFEAAFPTANLDKRDGLRIDLENSWLHLRASNTEPILRIIAEAKTAKDLKLLLQKSAKIVQG